MTQRRYKFTLSEETRKVCVNNLNEPGNDESIHDIIDRFKTNFSETHPSLELIRADDAFLLRFLRSCHFDIALSVKTLACYHKLRNEWRDVFELVEDKSKLENVLKKGAAMSLTGRAKDKSFILLKRPGISGETVKHFIASVFVSYEKLLEQEESQVYGFTVIADMTNLSFRFGMQMASLGKRFLKMLQEVLPIRINLLLVVNEGFAFGAVFAVASKFMRTSLREKIKLHKGNLVGLQKFIDEDILPPELHGTGPALDCEKWCNTVTS